MSDLDKVSYIDTNVWKIKQGSGMYRHILDFLHTTWGTTNKNFFPGPQPISIERLHFPILKRAEYVVCEKTDGLRHVCVCMMVGDKKICALIDRSQSMYLMSLRVPTSMFQGSLFDGELVKDLEGKWNYMVYDCLMIDGIHVSHLDLIRRIENAERFAKGITRLAKDPIFVKMKTFWNLRTNFGEFAQQEFPYKTDGIVLTPVNEAVRCGTHETMFKWKPRDANTIDFQFKKGYQKWNMYVAEKGQLIFESEVFENQMDPELLRDLKEDSIVECHYVHWEFPRWWRPLLIRKDKTHPNNRRTFYRTLKNISEDIQLIEFERLFKK